LGEDTLSTLPDLGTISRRVSGDPGNDTCRCLRFDPDKVFESLHQCPTINEAGRR
jgi:hypothetical protein